MASSLSEVFQTLQKVHFVGNAAAMGSVCTRVTLRTGVSIKNPRPEQDRDPALVAKVIGALADLGYAL